MVNAQAIILYIQFENYAFNFAAASIWGKLFNNSPTLKMAVPECITSKNVVQH